MRPSSIRLLVAALAALFVLHLIISYFSTETPIYLEPIRPPARAQHDDEWHSAAANGTRVKAAFVILTRNSDLYGIKKSVKQMEDRFNRNYHYPYVFLNDVPFTDEFKEHLRATTSSEVKFGVVPKEHWSYPAWIDQERAKNARKDMEQRNIIYGGSESYRHMCRFFSGFFFRHPLLDEYEYYWRVEPEVEYTCDIDFDPFLYMKTHGKKYAFTISLYEYQETIPTLWPTVKKFQETHPSLVRVPNALQWLSSDNGRTYNRCHFWSNFEIGSLNFYRSVEYMTYFEYLDKAGGFFYERWGDAPVHAIAVALFLKPEEVHFFNDIGYKHTPFQHCPAGGPFVRKCFCDPKDNFDFHGYSCTNRWLKLYHK